MDIIYLRELQIETIIGIFPWERAVSQKVRLDIELATDVKRAAQTDNIVDACDYDALAKRVTHFVEAASCHLLETLAEQVAELILAEFKITWVKLRISKPGAVANAKDVGVLIERGRKDN